MCKVPNTKFSRGRISSCEEGKGISCLWGKIKHGKKENGSNINFPIIFGLLKIIISGETEKGIKILGKKIKI